MKLIAESSSPGKLILSGEHSTVYGKDSVATTVDLYTKVKIFSIDDNENESKNIQLQLQNLDNFETNWNSDSLKQHGKLFENLNEFCVNEEIIKKVNDLIKHLDEESINVKNSCLVFLLLYLSIIDNSIEDGKCLIRVEVSSNLPNGAGLGSSSSYIVSLARALFVAFGTTIEKDRFNKLCYELDKLFHGKPSGVDNSICTYGGAILFRNGKIIKRIDDKNFPKLNMILVNTEVSRNTKNMVEKCKNRLNIFPNIGAQLLELLASISEQVWNCLMINNDNGDDNLKTKLPILFEMNQNLLNCLNVGHETIDQIVSIAKNYNFTAKLTGAGGGGIVIIYITDSTKEQDLIDELHKKNFKTYQVKLGVPGVQPSFLN